MPVLLVLSTVLGRNFHRTKITTITLIWCLKNVKDFILTFSISGSSCSEKEFLNLYTMILFSFPICGCFDENVDNRINYEGYKYVCFLQYHTLTVIHFTNGEGVFYINRKTIFNAYICLNHS